MQESKPKRGKIAEEKGVAELTKREAGEFRRRVAEWFAKHARDLPWRRTEDPYAILVSEIMCQQTQVGTVMPYYERWMRRFPDCAALAAATEPEVMGLWQGLGYYSRARNLHKAARVVAELGVFPRTVEDIRRLPGVGRYTAGAIAAFAYDAPAALVDANVARVLARVFGVREAVDGVGGLRAVWGFSEGLQGERGGRGFNGGLMEIGALVCTPRAPRCGECPVQGFCFAYRKGMQEELPVKKVRRKTVRVEERCAWIARDGEVLLEHQRGARWGGLWKLPVLEPAEGIPERKAVAVVVYPFTHHRVRLSVYAEKVPEKLREGCEWHALERLREVPMAAGHRRAVERVMRGGQAG